ncbi:alkaline phosphatase [Halovulum dunhuangense]|uniref:Alkaline phosphatase n=1 Tax=Halovulum dunhuangense TaxID=1505036 RepID=A0A849L118_9RHOB|nr:esterase-like activity of phytase family protein [Halovulum dunhuangense]NNU79976.1 alkaline phosphatase [Halovulum dunhuangense]
MTTRLLAGSALIALTAAMPALATPYFNRIASFATPQNMAAGEDQLRETSPEIVAVTEDGMTLVYTDSPLGVIGFVDLTDPASPQPLGNLELEGEPTSVAVIGQTAYVGMNSSESFVEPSGALLALDVASRAETARCDLGGQPDSVAAAPDGSFVAVAIENERDEDLNDGVIPQMPAGFVAIVPLENGAPQCDAIIRADLTGLAEVAGDDPEPEYLDINGLGEIVVTLQENNHIAVLGRDGAVLSHFTAGAVDLEGIDTAEDGALLFTDSVAGVLREPDTVVWIDDQHFLTANEGDYEGGSRGWTIFAKDGTVAHEDGTSFEQALVQIGHYPEGRSDSKGIEPESAGYAEFGDTRYAFVGSERGSILGIYMLDGTTPTLHQLLPSGIGPEGVLAIPSRNLLVTANETDLGEDGLARAHLMIYELQDVAAPAYPTLTSQGADELIGWTALSGLAAHPTEAGLLYAVNDSFLGHQPRIYEIDATQAPARITRAIDVTRDGRPAQKLDIEGIVALEDGGFWLASEGRTDRLIPHALYKVDADGAIEEEIAFPAELLAVERRFGAEGVTLIGDTLWIAIQREWGDDPENHAKLVSYNIETEEWGAVHYPKESPATGWVGLSEITVHGDWVYIVERDNQVGPNAVTKQLTRVPVAEMVPAPLGGVLPVVTKEPVRDLLPDLLRWNGFALDKIEGFAVDADGTGFVVTDNDGVDDHSGETLFWSIGAM